MELNCEYTLAIIFYNFRQKCIDELKQQFLAIKLHQGPVFIDGMVNSTKVVVHSKTNIVKVVQSQLLFQKPLIILHNTVLKIVNTEWAVSKTNRKAQEIRSKQDRGCVINLLKLKEAGAV